MHLSRFRPRFTIRRLMVTVAIVAIVVGIERLYERRLAFLIIASEQARLEDRALNLSRSLRGSVVLNEAKGYSAAARTWARWASAQDAEAISRGSKRRKYERAARYPWLSVEPEPETQPPSPK